MTTLVKIIVDDEAKRFVNVGIETADAEAAPRAKSEDYKVKPGSMLELVIHSYQRVTITEGDENEKAY